METILAIIVFLYACTGIISILGYLSTIKDLTKRIASANIYSYAIWTFSSCISFLYAFLLISDMLLEIVTGLNFVACAAILVLLLRLKNKSS